MLPRSNNITSTVIPSNSKPLQPASLLSFGIRMNSKKQLPPKISNKDEISSSKISRNTAINHHKKNNSMQEMEFCNRFDGYLNQQCCDMNNQNKQYKQQNQKDRLMLSQIILNRKIFTDQISQKPNLLKLSNITNMYLGQKQSFKENLINNQAPSLLTCHFFQDNMFENDNKNKTQKIYVDMKKKIKKISKSKRLLHKSQRIQGENLQLLQNDQQKRRREMAQHHRNLMNKAYMDTEVIIDSSIFCTKIIHHRIDNDVDTDEEQIKSGINKLKKSLEEATRQNQNWLTEKKKFMQEMQNYNDNQMQQQLSPQPNFFY